MSATPKLAKPARRSQRKGKAPEPDLTATLAALQEGDSTGGELSARFHQITDAALALPGVEHAGLLLATPSSGLRAVATSGASPIPGDTALTREGDLLHWGAGSGQLRLAGSGSPAPDGEDQPHAIAVPLMLYGSEVGLLVVSAPSWDEDERTRHRATLETIARLAAPAAAAAKLSALDTHFIEVHSIVEVGQVLTGLLDMEDVLSYVVYLAESLVGGHNTTVALVTEDGEHLMLRNSTGTLRSSEGRLIPVNGSLMGWVVRNGSATITPSLAEDPRGFPWEDRYGPSVVVPLTSNGKIIGTFMVTRVEGSPHFTEESAEVLRTMASYATIAITNAEIHRQQREVADTLRQQAAELERAYHELNRSQEQLLISEKMAALGRVTAGIAHEINSPLAGILNSLRTARSYVEEYRTSAGDPDITAEDHQGIADDILSALAVAETSVTKVAQFVKTIKGQTRVGAGQKSTFDPAAEVDSAVSLLQHELRRRRVAVYTEMQRGHELSGDQSKFGLVVQNLISNALDAYEGKPGEIWVRMAVKDEGLQVAVEDQGCGIPEEIRGRIFDYLFTTKDVGKGTGLGLAMVHSVVTSDFGGTVALDSEPGVGTTFTLTFPLTTVETEHGA